MRLALGGAVLLLAMSACGETGQPTGPADDIQIIVHVPLAGDTADASQLARWTAETKRVEGLAERHAAGLYEWNGHDLAKGGTNYVFSSRQPERAAKRLVDLVKVGVFARRSVIGVAQYNKDRTDWTYRIVYPVGLTTFDFE